MPFRVRESDEQGRQRQQIQMIGVCLLNQRHHVADNGRHQRAGHRYGNTSGDGQAQSGPRADQPRQRRRRWPRPRRERHLNHPRIADEAVQQRPQFDRFDT